MKKFIILVFILCLVTNNTTFSQDYNENDYTTNTGALIKMYNEFKYRSDKKYEFLMLHNYIRGMENTLGAMSVTLENEHNFKLFCPPENLVLEKRSNILMAFLCLSFLIKRKTNCLQREILTEFGQDLLAIQMMVFF